MIRIAVCDGEPSFAWLLRRRICEWEDENGQDLEYLEKTDSDDLVELCMERGNIDIVFLAHKPQKGPDGAAAVKDLKKTDDKINIVLVTAERMIDVEIVRFQPFGILPLPFEYNDVKAFIDSCVRNRKDLFVISASCERIAIPIDQICYINKKPHPDFRLIEIHCCNGQVYQTYMTTKEVEMQLLASERMFLRIRNSCFANPFFVRSINGVHVTLFEDACGNDNELVFGRGYAKAANRAYTEYLAGRTHRKSIAI